MTNQKRTVPAAPSGRLAFVRRMTINAIGLRLMMPLMACGQEEGKIQSEAVLNVVLYSYLDRVNIDIIFNGTDLGVANKYGCTGTMAGVSVPFGVQSLKWTLDGPAGTPRNGESIKIKNKLTISPTQITSSTRYIGVHLYPDDTAEGTFSEHIPERTAHGEKILAARR